MNKLVILLAAFSQANPAGGLYTDGAYKFMRDFGFPIFIAVGLFALFGVLMWLMARSFFRNMENANEERKEITTQFTGVLEGALQNNTEQLTLANESLRQSCEAIGKLGETNSQQHGDLLRAIDGCDTRLATVEAVIRNPKKSTERVG